MQYPRQQPKEVQLPARLPLVGALNQRLYNPATDSRLINGYVEVGEDDVLRVVKRPGLFLKYEFSGFGSGMAGPLSFFYDPVEGGYSGKLHLDGGAATTFASYADAGSPPSRYFSADLVPDGLLSNLYFIHNGYQAYLYDIVDGLTSVPRLAEPFGPLTASITNGSPNVTVATTVGLTKYAVVLGTGIPANTFIESISSPTVFVMSAPATVTNATASLTFEQGGPGFTPYSTGRYLAAGVVNLNGSTYLFTTRNQVQGSDLFEPYSWNPLNSVFAYANQDQAAAISKQLSYIIAMKSGSIEFFRDAGLSPGSPLERLEGMRMDVGLWNGRTVQVIDGQVIWCSTTESGLRSVWLLNALKPSEVASPAVRRLLEDMDPQYAISFSSAGHSFYILTDPVAGISLAYDLSTRYWSLWNALGETYFPFVAAVHTSEETRLQHESNGNIYVLDPELGTDDGEDFTMEIFPPQYDAGMRVTKYLNRMYVIADQESEGTLEVRINDQDQAPTEWSPWREFDLAHPRPAIWQCGSFTKRWFHFRHVSGRCRLTAVELDLLPGSL